MDWIRHRILRKDDTTFDRTIGTREGLHHQQIAHSDATSLGNLSNAKLLHRGISPNSPLVIMELMSEGDLASFLRHLGSLGQGSVSRNQSYLWATQISDGMAYLASKRYVHRDLAARNCMLDARLILKIGDFGLCRDMFDRDYYQKRGRGRLPIRWMSPESLHSAYFTSQSDVWSFGVVLWEITTMASLPYGGMSHEDVIQYVCDGNTLLTNGAPTNCPELFFALMHHCWTYEPHNRPTFLGICSLLSPRFGDAEFRLNSFFYQGEKSLDPHYNTSTLEPPFLLLAKYTKPTACSDSAHDLTTALTAVTPTSAHHLMSLSKLNEHDKETGEIDRKANNGSDKGNHQMPDLVDLAGFASQRVTSHPNITIADDAPADLTLVQVCRLLHTNNDVRNDTISCTSRSSSIDDTFRGGSHFTATDSLIPKLSSLQIDKLH